MRRILTIASLLLVSAAHSQTSIVPVGSPTQITEERGGQSAVHLLATPIKEPYDSVYSSFRKKGRLITTSDGHLYHNNGTVYLYCIREDDSTVKYVTPAQFATLSASVSSKKDAADSTNPVYGYVPQHQLDSAKKAIRSSIGLKLNIADTNAMLSNYLRINIAATTYVALAGSYSNPSWITGLAWSKITGTPTTISGYGITDYNSLWDTRLGTKTTDNLTEGSTNKYYSNSLARAAITFTTTGTSGAGTYNSSTGAMNIPNYTLAGLGGIPYPDTARNGKVSSKYYTDSLRIADRFIDSSSYYVSPLVEHAVFTNVTGSLTRVGETTWRGTNPIVYGVGRANRMLLYNHDGYYQMKNYDDAYCGIVLDTTAPTSTPTFLIAIVIYAGNVYFGLNNSYPYNTGATYLYYRLRRSGSSWYGEGSNDERKWDIVYTYSFSYTGTCYPFSLLPTTPRMGRLYEPKLCGFSTYGCISGNSTIASYLGQSRVDEFIFNTQEAATGFSVNNIAVPGHTIAQQMTTWQAQSTATKLSYNYVLVAVGLNNLNPAVSAATEIASYQEYIDTIRRQTSPNCKIIVSTMTPCKLRLYDVYTTNGAASQQKWVDINYAIMNTITNVDYRVSRHTSLMATPSGNLDSVFEVHGTFDHIHQNNAGRALEASVWRQGLQEMKLLPQRLEIKKPLTVVANLNFGSTSAQNSADLIVPVIGAAVGDRVDLGSPTPASHTNYTAFVSAANTITVRFNNYSSGSVDPAAADFEVTIYK